MRFSTVKPEQAGSRGASAGLPSSQSWSVVAQWEVEASGELKKLRAAQMTTAL